MQADFEYKLKTSIKAQGFTLEEFSSRLGLSYQTFRNRLIRRAFTMEDINKMIRFLHIRYEDVFYSEPPKK